MPNRTDQKQANQAMATPLAASLSSMTATDLVAISVVAGLLPEKLFHRLIEHLSTV